MSTRRGSSESVVRRSTRRTRRTVGSRRSSSRSWRPSGPSSDRAAIPSRRTATCSRRSGSCPRPRDGTSVSRRLSAPTCRSGLQRRRTPSSRSTSTGAGGSTSRVIDPRQRSAYHLYHRGMVTSGSVAIGSVIEVRGLVKRYGDLVAVDGIDFEVAPGEVFGLLGPNGAGKTTTVEILEGLRRRDGGIVSVLGHDPE